MSSLVSPANKSDFMPIIIAEIKTQSPFGFRSKLNWDELFAIANTHGDWLSIHTDPRWGGSLELIRKARSLTTKPILAKGIHAHDSDIAHAIEAGADYVLVVGRIPKIHLEKCLIEPKRLQELSNIPTNTKVVWNARDLDTGAQKLETFEQARSIFPGWLCQASFVQRPEDIKPGADAVLIGEHLLGFIAAQK